MIIIIIIIIIICHSPRLVGPKAVGIIIRTTVSVFRSGKKQNNSSEYVSLSCECENGKSSLEYLSGSANYYHYHNAENYEDVILIKMMITIPVKPVTECVAIAKGAKYRDTAAILPATNTNSKIAQQIHLTSGQNVLVFSM